jgi:2-(1,2-epoxy-1,2-dihydrophenyl)acetyl-CoA isomerase
MLNELLHMTHIRADIAGAVGTITIDRPDRFNSLDVATARDLRHAGLNFARDPEVRAVVLRGIPGVFCSGADLKYIREGGDAAGLGYLQPRPEARGPRPEYGDVFKQILEYIHSTISEIRRAPKPVLAAVDGIAAAGGFGLAMACDIVVASERSTFEWAYSKTGLTGAESSTFMLPRLIGLRRSLELLFLNPRIDAKRALDIGLITTVVPSDTFDRDVHEIAQRLASGPAEAWGIAKELMNQAAGMDRLDVHLDRELDNLARIADGANFAEGIEAFFEKRAPVFGVK